MPIEHNKPLTNELVTQILNEIALGHQISPARILEASMNLLMQAERKLHLEQNPEDKGNGSFSRQLGTAIGKLNLEVPRDRDGDFRPAILPDPYQRDYREREELLESLLLNSYSPNAIQRTLHGLNLHYNPKEVESLKNHYLELSQQWQQRELPEDVLGLFLDAYHAETLVNNKVCKAVIYVVIGIDFLGHKSLFGLYLYTGNESKAFWLQTLNQLIQRGVSSPLFVISDDFSGLKEAVATLYPQAFHQLCFVHMQRNIYKNMGREDAKNFLQTLETIKFAQNAELACQQFSQLCQRFEKNYPTFIKSLLSKTKHYFAFVHLNQDIRKFFYTTNSVESFNSILEKHRLQMGGFFQSEECLRVNVFITLRRLHKKKWKNGVPLIKASLYSLRQLFVAQYQRLPKETKVLDFAIHTSTSTHLST